MRLSVFMLNIFLCSNTLQLKPRLDARNVSLETRFQTKARRLAFPVQVHPRSDAVRAKSRPDAFFIYVSSRVDAFHMKNAFKRTISAFCVYMGIATHK